MKRLALYIITALFLLETTACSDFLDTVPHDSLVPVTTWKTEDDAAKFLVGCYDGWVNVDELFYWDAASDIGFANFAHDSWWYMGNGGMTANTAYNFYDFKMIRRCNTFLSNIDKIEFQDEAVKNDMIGQAKTIRAYQYFNKNWWYGGVPIIENYETAEDAKVERNTEEEVKQFVYDELDAAIPLLKDVPAARGYIAKGAALAIKMRSALYYADYERAKDAAKAIMDLRIYELEPDYANIFKVEGQDSKEIISSLQYILNTKTLFHLGMCFYNNSDNGWAGVAPVQNLVDMYEMTDGLTKEESALYDATHPFANRDPRMGMTILIPGQNWAGWIHNTLDRQVQNADGTVSTNINYPGSSDNASKTILTWAKYCGTGPDYYADIFATNACPIVFRYAEVLLSYAEAENELNGPSNEIYAMLDQVRNRVGMPEVDRTKYDTQEKLRELIRRERCVELAGEGLRRADIVRWKDSNGKMVAETVLNGKLIRISGTVNYEETDPYKRAAATGTSLLEERIFQPHNRYLPIPQNAIDKNPKLKQNTGY